MNPRKNWKLFYQGSLEDFDPRVSVEYWQKQNSAERFKETCTLIEQAMRMKGRTIADVSRLLRTTAVLKRQ